MESTVNPIQELEKAALCQSIKKELKIGGIASIIFGVINMITSFPAIKDNPLNILLALISLGLLLEGLWLVFYLKYQGLIAEAVMFALLGVWNIFISITNMKNDPSGDSSKFLFFGVIQIGFAINCFIKYMKFRKTCVPMPGDETIKKVATYVKEMSKASANMDLDLIEFSAGNGIFQTAWKAKLYDGVWFFLSMQNKQLLVVEKHDIAVTEKGNKALSKKTKIAIRIGKKEFKNGSIIPQLLKRFDLPPAAPQVIY